MANTRCEAKHWTDEEEVARIKACLDGIRAINNHIDGCLQPEDIPKVAAKLRLPNVLVALIADEGVSLEDLEEWSASPLAQRAVKEWYEESWPGDEDEDEE